MRAITLWQPWASLVVMGWKRWETRRWATNHRGDVAIHAAKYAVPNLSASVRAAAERLLKCRVEDLPRGAVVGTARLIEVRSTVRRPENLPEWEVLFGDFRPGRYMWRLTDMRPLDPPVPARGYQGLWYWSGR